MLVSLHYLKTSVASCVNMLTPESLSQIHSTTEVCTYMYALHAQHRHTDLHLVVPGNKVKTHLVDNLILW